MEAIALDSDDTDVGEEPFEVDSVFGDLGDLVDDEPQDLVSDGESEPPALGAAERVQSSSDDDVPVAHGVAVEAQGEATSSRHSIMRPRIRCRTKGPRERMHDVGRLKRPSVLKRPAGPEPAGCAVKVSKLDERHKCHGLDHAPCIFNAASPGAPARYNREQQCPWCSEAQLGEALATGNGKDMLGRSLRSFWEKDKDVFHAAVARLPDEEKTFFPLRALGLPPCFRSEEAVAKAASTKDGRGQLTRALNSLQKKDVDLHDMAMEVLPVDLREARIAVAKKPAVRKKPARASRPDQWRDALLHRKSCIRHSDADKAKFHAKFSEDKKHARTRFFPVRAKTWMNKTRDLGVPDDFEFPSESCVKDMVVDETGLPNPDKMSANALRFQEWCKLGSWSSCSQCHRLVPRSLEPKTCASKFLQRFGPASIVLLELDTPQCRLKNNLRPCEV